jgi:hypothetical protein
MELDCLCCEATALFAAFGLMVAMLAGNTTRLI